MADVIDLTPRIEAKRFEEETEKWMEEILSLPHVYDELIGGAACVASEIGYLVDNEVIPEHLLHNADACSTALADLVKGLTEYVNEKGGE